MVYHDNQQNMIGLLSTYRLLIALLLLGMHNIELAERLVGARHPLLFQSTLLIYATGNILTLALSLNGRIKPTGPILFAIAMLDILALNLLIQANGYQAPPLSLLFVLAVIGSATVMSARLSMLLAAMATLSVLSQAGLRILAHAAAGSELVSAGTLGLIFFITALAVQQLGRRATRSERLASQRASDILELQQLNETIVQRMRTGLIVIDNVGHIHLINESARKLLGFADVDPSAGPDSIPAPLLETWRSWSANPRQLPPLYRPNPAAPPIRASFSPLDGAGSNQSLVFLEDSRLMTQQAQAMKLASLGRLTGSIAHEVRNPLGAISHAAQLLGESSSLGAEDRRFCEIIMSQSQRVNEVIENVLNLSRHRQLKPRPLNLVRHLSNFIKDYVSQLQMKGVRAELAFEPQIDTITINFDPSQLDQVLANLIDNGLRHSQLHTGRATVTIKAYCESSRHLPQLDIIDQGAGVEDGQIADIFEPFFTTQQSGTGLGLYLAREICEAHQTQLVYLKTERQSCFRLTFAHPRKRWLN